MKIQPENAVKFAEENIDYIVWMFKDTAKDLFFVVSFYLAVYAAFAVFYQ